ncbi:MAG: hypothetical protein LBI19_02225 [Oscillospiraceae bacterium]|nr:hypothetical protein [Oscillospiraceae bacterium]
MTKELYRVRSKKTVLSVVNSAVSAVQKSSTVKTGLRLYDNGCIGVAGAIGAYDENRLIDHAKQMLTFKIPYDCGPAAEIKRSVDLADSFTLDEEDFVKSSEELLAMLEKRYPRFAFSHKITYEESETSLQNSCGADLVCRDKAVQAQLLIKHKNSKSLMDSVGVDVMRGFDTDSMFKAISETCACYEEKISVPDRKMPVVMLLDHSVLHKFYSDLNGRTMGTGASMFSGKLGQKLFADHFSLNIERFPREQYRCFFDAEGTVLPNDRLSLIENGVLKTPFSSKKIAKEYGFAPTGSAGGEYDSVPDTSIEGLQVQSSGKTISDLLGGRKAVYVVFASGGDFTSQGEYASPVQSAFLFEKGNLLGRLPQLSISSSIYDMFGADFIGLSSDGNSPHTPLRYLAMDMDVATIGDWL